MTQNISGGEVSAKKTNEKNTYIRNRQATVEGFSTNGEPITLEYNYEEIQNWVGRILERGYDLLQRYRESNKRDMSDIYKREIEEAILARTDQSSNDRYDAACKSGILTKGQQTSISALRTTIFDAFISKENYYKEKRQQQQNGGMSNRNYDVAKRVADTITEDELF